MIQELKLKIILEKDENNIYNVCTKVSDQYIELGINKDLIFPKYCYDRFYKEQLDEYINNIFKSLEDEFFITDITIEDKFLIMGEYNIIKEASVIITYKMNRLS